ncbi:ArsR family transcriptional regulator [Halobacteriales archaeon QS_1_68_20]|nr:MAG: ArsR family transcriptional regulator [Halobacteriales archaeon QS_1_68_20]
MADLLPSTPDLSAAENAEPRVIGVDSKDADDLISALSAGTARELLSALHDEPANPAALADRVDTSLQNAQYHLSKLEDAGVVEVVDTVYSEKGREMNVYAPSDQPLVVYAGKEEETTGLKAALSRLLGAMGILAVASAVVEHVVGERDDGTFFVGAPAGGDDGAPANTTETGTPEWVAQDAETATPSPEEVGTESTPVPEATESPMPTGEPTSSPTPVAEPTDTSAPTETVSDAMETPQEAVPSLVDAAGGLPPGLLFFAGGATVLVLGFLWYYRDEVRAALASATR